MCDNLTNHDCVWWPIVFYSFKQLKGWKKSQVCLEVSTSNWLNGSSRCVRVYIFLWLCSQTLIPNNRYKDILPLGEHVLFKVLFIWTELNCLCRSVLSLDVTFSMCSPSCFLLFLCESVYLFDLTLYTSTFPWLCFTSCTCQIYSVLLFSRPLRMTSPSERNFGHSWNGCEKVLM